MRPGHRYSLILTDQGRRDCTADVRHLRDLVGDARARARSAQLVLLAVVDPDMPWWDQLALPSLAALAGRVALDLAVVERDLDLLVVVGL